MVKQVSVKATVAVGTGMDMDEPERHAGGSDHGREGIIHALSEGEKPPHEGGQVLRPCADVLGDRHARVSVMFTEKPPSFRKPVRTKEEKPTTISCRRTNSSRSKRRLPASPMTRGHGGKAICLQGTVQSASNLRNRSAVLSYQERLTALFMRSS